MKKFKVEISRSTYQSGFYELEAPDKDAAYILAEDIKFSDPRVTWDPITEPGDGYPKPMNIFVTEVKE